MSLLKDAIRDGQIGAEEAPSLNLKNGGQHGFLPHIGTAGDDGKLLGEWMSNQAYVQRNVVPVLLQAPKFFNFFGDEKAKDLVATLKALVELHPLTIEGFNSGLTVEVEEHASGIAGQMQQEFTKVTRERTSVTTTYKEKAGVPIRRFLDFWIRYGIMDPDTESPLVTTLEAYAADAPKIYSPDYMTMSVLYFEPDVTNRHVTEGWLCFNMAPLGTGDITGKRDKQTAGATLDVSVPWSTLALHNTYVRRMAQTMLEGMSVLKTLPDLAVKGKTEVDSGVAASEVGYDTYKS